MPTQNQIVTFVRQQYSLVVKKAKLFPSGVMNRNYLLDTDQGRFVLRILDVRGLPQTRFEALMLRRLAATGFPCPSPLTSTDREPSVEGRPVLLYPLLPGRHVSRGTPKILGQIGALQGSMHKLFLGRPAPVRKEGWDPEDIRRMLPQWKRRFLTSRFPDAKNWFRFLEDELAGCRFPASLPRGWTHQDIKPENALVEGGRVSGILDFDNCYRGALLHDMTTTIMWWCFPDRHLDPSLLESFLNAYDAERRLTVTETRLLLGDGMRFRLLREMFIGPITTLSNIPFAVRHARHFRTIYRNLFGA